MKIFVKKSTYQKNTRNRKHNYLMIKGTEAIIKTKENSKSYI